MPASSFLSCRAGVGNRLSGSFGALDDLSPPSTAGRCELPGAEGPGQVSDGVDWRPGSCRPGPPPRCPSLGPGNPGVFYGWRSRGRPALPPWTRGLRRVPAMDSGDPVGGECPLRLLALALGYVSPENEYFFCKLFSTIFLFSYTISSISRACPVLRGSVT